MPLTEEPRETPANHAPWFAGGVVAVALLAGVPAAVAAAGRQRTG